MASSPITSWQIKREKVEAVTDSFLGLKNLYRQWLQPPNQKMTNLDSILKSRAITLLTKVCIVKAMVFPVVMYKRENWTQRSLKNWCYCIVVLEKTLESSLDCEKIKSVSPKENHPWIFIGRIDAKAEAPMLWPPMWRPDSLEKTLMLGKIEGRGRKEDELAGWHHWLNKH